MSSERKQSAAAYIYIPREVLSPPTRERVRATPTFGSIDQLALDLEFPLHLLLSSYWERKAASGCACYGGVDDIYGGCVSAIASEADRSRRVTVVSASSLPAGGGDERELCVYIYSWEVEQEAGDALQS